MLQPDLNWKEHIFKKCLSKQAPQRSGSGRAKHTPYSCFISKTRSIAPLTFAVTSPCPLSTPGPCTWPFYDCCTFFGWFPQWQNLHRSVTDTHPHSHVKGVLHADKTHMQRQVTVCLQIYVHKKHSLPHPPSSEDKRGLQRPGGRGLGQSCWWLEVEMGEATSCFAMQKRAPGLG